MIFHFYAKTHPQGILFTHVNIKPRTRVASHILTHLARKYVTVAIVPRQDRAYEWGGNIFWAELTV